MVEKLKSISKQIPWSLLLKPIVFGAVWFIAPTWVSIVSAVLLYSVPFFITGGTLLQFFITMLLVVLLPHSLMNAVGLSIVFGLIIGIQEHIFAYRLRAYEVITVMVLFLVSFAVFAFAIHADQQIPPFPFIGSAVLFFFLLKNTMRRYVIAVDEPSKTHVGFLAGLATLLLSEAMVILLLLPLTMFAQTALFILLGTLLLDQTSDYLRGTMTSGRTAFAASLFFMVLISVLVLTPWHP